MLASRSIKPCRAPLSRRQGGVVMLVALIVLVVMTLAGIGLMRSMDTSSMIAGNMAFKQAATHSADVGLETAIAWLEQQSAINALDNYQGQGYTARSDNNANLKTGDAFWNQLKYATASGAASGSENVCHLNALGQGCAAAAEPNANGNKISYMIQRLCPTAGTRAGCAVVAGAVVSAGNSTNAGEPGLDSPFAQVYYRVTVRVEGPRNSVSYVQSVVAL